MSARTTDDYERMAKAGIRAVIEPAFWLGQPRTTAGSFKDYFSALVGWEKFRAAQFGIHHFCAIGLNAKEANNESMADEVMELIPRFVGKENVVAIGEIGFDDMTAMEEKYFHAQIDLAKELDMPIMVHTPHRNKKQGTYRSMDILEEHKVDPAMVVIDHNNEDTVEEVRNRGFWCAFTIIPAIACFDDKFFLRISPRQIKSRLLSIKFSGLNKKQKISLGIYAGMVILLSINPVINLISKRQAMNRAFEPFHLVNTYGAFGSIGKIRNEIIVQGTMDSIIGAETQWNEYEFKCKPGALDQIPCMYAPYHLRLDWQMWFAAFQNPNQNPWFIHMIYKLLKADSDILELMDRDPFKGMPPRYIRAELYRYTFSNDGSAKYWDRHRVAPYLPALSVLNPGLLQYIKNNKWPF